MTAEILRKPDPGDSPPILAPHRLKRSLVMARLERERISDWKFSREGRSRLPSTKGLDNSVPEGSLARRRRSAGIGRCPEGCALGRWAPNDGNPGALAGGKFVALPMLSQRVLQGLIGRSAGLFEHQKLVGSRSQPCIVIKAEFAQGGEDSVSIPVHVKGMGGFALKWLASAEWRCQVRPAHPEHPQEMLSFKRIKPKGSAHCFGAAAHNEGSRAVGCCRQQVRLTC